MQEALSELIVVLKKLGIVIFIYTLCRLIFFLFNMSYFNHDGLFLAFLGGVRFDLSAIVYINAAYILFKLIPFPFRENKTYQRVLEYLFLVTNSFGILFNCLDIEYFKFTLKRSTYDLFTLVNTGDDVSNLIPQFIKDYWYLILIALSLILFLVWTSHKVDKIRFRPQWSKKFYLQSVLIFLLVIGLGIIAGRGGLQYRPIGLINATLYGKSDKMPLILNTPFSIIRSSNANYLSEVEYFSSTDELQKHFEIKKNITPLIERRENVVLIMLESFSYEFMNTIGEHGQYLSPFLDSLSKQSLFFHRAYANGKKSVEGVPSIVSGIPSLMTNPFIFSPYSANKVNSLASLLNEEGYTSTFFHGGVNGTMGFDAFALSSGFDKYYGQSEYPYEGHSDGTWGIFDEEYFSYFNDMISEQKEPFFSLCFSLTSHHPFKVPERYEDKFPKAKNNYERVIQYTDYSLKTFFEKAKRTDWFQNTVFVITADHTAQSFDPYYRNREGIFRVPLLFFHPTDIVPAQPEMIAQQIDILPTLLSFLGMEKEINCFGNNLMANHENVTFQYLNNIYQIQNRNYHLEFDGEKSIALYNLQTDSLLKTNLINKGETKEYLHLENRLKAVIQEYNSRMTNNRLTE